MVDIFSNFLSLVQNGFKSKKSYIDVPQSRKLKKLILFFIKEGFFLGYEEIILTFPIFRIYLKYDGQKPVISGLIRISKVSRRVYINVVTLSRLYKSSFVLVLSTKFGYLNGYQALQRKSGGEFFCIIY
jgi:small subunit ribosomal protein S8